MAGNVKPMADVGRVKLDVHVSCPDRPPTDPYFRLPQVSDALDQLWRMGAPSLIPLEQNLAKTPANAAILRQATDIPFARFEHRPATETVLHRSWSSLMGSTSMADIDDLVTGLLGQPSNRRRLRSMTEYASDGTRSVFPSVEQAEGWLDRVDAAERSDTGPFALACFAYAQTVLNHPYRDGNGRLARAMYQRSLGRSGLLRGPLLPLGPLVYANCRVHDRALQHLGETGDWGPFVDVLIKLTQKAAAYTRHALSAGRS